MKNGIVDAIPDTGPVVIFNVAASEGGAFSVLTDLYDQLVQQERIHPVYLVHSAGAFAQKGAVMPIKRIWIKRSWAHRLLWEWIFAPRLARKIHATTIVSLQNVITPFVSTDVLLVHNPLPFSGVHFSLLAQPRLWLYEHVISRLILWSVKRSRFTVVQTEWMKQALTDRLNIEDARLLVIPPHVVPVNMNIPTDIAASTNEVKNATVDFFYPASHVVYKDHDCLAKATELLFETGKRKFTVTLTLRGTEAKHIRKVRERVEQQDLPLHFVGIVPRDEVHSRLRRSVLVFPSRVETFGLPLLEARNAGAHIIAVDLPYAREVLADYDKVDFFEPGDAIGLAAIMARHLPE